MQQSERLHALDAVRAFALLMGVVLHATMSFLPSLGKLGFPIIDNSPSYALGYLFFVVHIFRMTVFFLIAGFFARLVFHRKGTRAFIKDKSKRIVLPLVVGWLVLMVLITIVFVWAIYKNNGGHLPQPEPNSKSAFSLAHLWFLYYLLWMYAIVLVIRSIFVRIDGAGNVRRSIDRAIHFLVSSNLAPLFFATPMALALYLVDKWQVVGGIPTPDKSLVPEWPSLIGFGVAFGFGWLLQRQVDLLRVWEQRWRLNLSVAVLVTIICIVVLHSSFADAFSLTNSFPSNGWQKACYAILYALAVWISTIAVVGIGMRFFANESPVRRYLADSSYWIYLVHLPLVFALQTAVMHLNLHWSIKFTGILLVAFSVLLASYHYCVRSTFIGAILNGRKYSRVRVEPQAAAV